MDRSTESTPATSPNAWKSVTPAAFAAAWIRGSHSPKNAEFTCRAVSMRKPSILYFRTQPA